VIRGTSAGRTYVGMYSMVIVPEFRATFWSCWPLKDEKAATSETTTMAAIKQEADFMVFCYGGVTHGGSFPSTFVEYGESID
jgi:hypothetical protein